MARVGALARVLPSPVPWRYEADSARYGGCLLAPRSYRSLRRGHGRCDVRLRPGLLVQEARPQHVPVGVPDWPSVRSRLLVGGLLSSSSSGPVRKVTREPAGPVRTAAAHEPTSCRSRGSCARTSPHRLGDSGRSSLVEVGELDPVRALVDDRRLRHSDLPSRAYVSASASATSMDSIGFRSHRYRSSFAASRTPPAGAGRQPLPCSGRRARGAGFGALAGPAPRTRRRGS